MHPKIMEAFPEFTDLHKMVPKCYISIHYCIKFNLVMVLVSFLVVDTILKIGPWLTTHICKAANHSGCFHLHYILRISECPCWATSVATTILHKWLHGSSTASNRAEVWTYLLGCQAQCSDPPQLPLHWCCNRASARHAQMSSKETNSASHHHLGISLKNVCAPHFRACHLRNVLRRVSVWRSRAVSKLQTPGQRAKIPGAG